MTEPMTDPRRWPKGPGLFTAGAMAAGVLLSGCTPTDQGTEAGEAPYLAVPGSPMAAPEYEFTTTEGAPWSFTGATEDRITLLYFGYTSCPDVCPTTMADISDALTRIGGKADQVDVVMVSTDPERDTDEQLGTWLRGFDPGFDGVRGPVDDVVAAALAYGIPVEAPATEGGDYLVTHGGRVAVLRPGGDAVGFFDEGTSGAQMSGTLPRLIDEWL
ncbi:SCO family protein [Nocardiopsis ansamitocini]|uniref:SCO family protein n=1 Tax=Nocardiopsis ansamitocini TaxID=1670832 RepID=A0A9W6UHU2_9ACTN|nr:SCO family protein [Nocardiopsis ansamitocini]GLU46984.1 SCO family protein [Nocardiopsis ansamitocini]